MYQGRIKEAQLEMDKVLGSFHEELKALHTGRATPALVEEISVSYYGTPTPLKHVASITAPDPKLINISPWDKTILTEIENAVRLAGLGVNPTNDGNMVRLSLPPMTEERRRELVKKLHQRGEEIKIAFRTIRREAWDEIQEMEKSAKISEDDRYAAEKQLNKLVDDLNEKVDAAAATKEKEVLTV